MPIRLFVPLSGLLLLALATSGTAAARQSPAPSSATPAAQQVPVSGSGEGEGDVADLPPARSIAVIPFSNISKDAADDWIGDGIAETVGADLESLDDMVVIGREMVSSALDEGVPALPDATAAARLGRDLGVGWVVTGGYQRVGQMLRITARLVDAVTGRVTGTLTADGTIDEIFALQDRIVAGLLTEAAGSEESLLPDPGAGDRDVTAGDADSYDPRARGAGGVGNLAGPGPGAAAGQIVLPGTAGVGGLRGGPGARGAAPAAAVPAGILTGRPSVTAVRADESPTIDGRLDDAVWESATRITEFVQSTPVEGAPATEDTEVYVAFDSTHLYIGMYAHYSDPGLVRANRVDRDQASRGDDTISVYFDTFLDQQRAFVFTLNGYGVQGDALMGGGGGGGRGGGRRGGGGGGGVPRGDDSWDVLFDSGGALVDDGWTAEMAIPFKSLRYPATGGGAHRWGFQIARSIRGKNETDVWSPVSRDVSGFLPQMGLLDGLSNLSTSRNLELLPTFTAVQVGSLDLANGRFGEEREPEGGFNLKYGVTSNLTLDFTYNPDFSQIESDRPQIEVNQRFPIFFSELRPFFLEGQEVFRVPGPVNLVHTRTIVDPRYGGKLTGKVGKTTLGLLFANDEAPGNVDDPTERVFGQTANVFIGRARYDLYSESHLGAIVTDREFVDSYSRMAGVDGNFRLSRASSIGFRALMTQNRDLDGEETSGPLFDISFRNNGRNLSYRASYYSIDPEFDTEVGFVRRRDIRRSSGNVGYRWWPESWIINWGPSVNYSRNWNFDDVLEDERTEVGVNMQFARNLRFNADVERSLERYRDTDYHKTRYSLGGNVNTSQVISLGGRYNWGDEIRYGAEPILGEGSDVNLFVTMRPYSRLQTQVNMSTSRLVDSADHLEVFNVKIFRALTTYQFSDRLVLRNILEHNTFNRTLGANLLLTYRVNSGTVFFIGYDDRYKQGDLILDDDDQPVFLTTDMLRTNRAFFMKISYLFRY